MKWWPNYCTRMDKLDGGLLGCLHFFFKEKRIRSGENILTYSLKKYTLCILWIQCS